MSVKSKGKHVLLLVLVAVAALSTILHPEVRRVNQSAGRLPSVPQSFGAWTMRSQNTVADSKEASFLNDVLYRTYQRADGKTVLLVVAYGADQRKKFNLHMPEVCYKASGYQVMSQAESLMHDPELKLKQLVVTAGAADTQPVQYWIMLDGRQVTSELEKRIRHLYYSVVGAQTDGVLVRVSSFLSDGDPGKEYEIQQEFIGSLYKSADPQLKKLLFGKAV